MKLVRIVIKLVTIVIKLVMIVIKLVRIVIKLVRISIKLVRIVIKLVRIVIKHTVVVHALICPWSDGRLATIGQKTFGRKDTFPRGYQAERTLGRTDK